MTPSACYALYQSSQILNPSAHEREDYLRAVTDGATLLAGRLQQAMDIYCAIPSGIVQGACLVASIVENPEQGAESLALNVAGSLALAGVGKLLKTGAKLLSKTPLAQKALAAVGKLLSGGRCSFSPDTPVLMGNGTTKAIGKIRPGDKVEAADPNTGKVKGSRTVQHVWINHDTDLLDVTISDGNGHSSTIHTTANHPFWDDTLHVWQRADHLKPGHHLASTNRRHPAVVKIKATPGTADRWNLTVQELHTYYVVAGGTPILVHNTDGESCKVDLGNGTFLHPDGSIRDANGHYAGTTGVQPGANNEETVWDHLQTEGVTVVRQETSVRVPGFKLRKFDGLANIDGNWYGIETKGASAGRTPDQELFDGWLNTPGNTAVTLNGQYELHGVFDAWVPQDRPPAG
ncbi:polymorphic toxin-type HINT domain-containing protein [Streptacidiphilus monticola]